MRRYLVLGEETETAWCPDWYATIQAAKYLGVPPWQLMDQSVVWTQWAFKAMTAESEAQEIKQKQAEAKHK